MSWRVWVSTDYWMVTVVHNQRSLAEYEELLVSSQPHLGFLPAPSFRGSSALSERTFMVLALKPPRQSSLISPAFDSSTAISPAFDPPTVFKTNSSICFAWLICIDSFMGRDIHPLVVYPPSHLSHSTPSTPTHFLACRVIPPHLCSAVISSPFHHGLFASCVSSLHLVARAVASSQLEGLSRDPVWLRDCRRSADVNV